MTDRHVTVLGPDSKPGRAPEPASDTTPRLALRPKEAAKALGIGTRLLWSMTNRGEIPHVKLGKVVLYPVDELRRYLSENTQRKRSNRR